jgi:signal transduction histidine kinase/CheY-like chemotaxis protein
MSLIITSDLVQPGPGHVATAAANGSGVPPIMSSPSLELTSTNDNVMPNNGYHGGSVAAATVTVTSESAAATKSSQIEFNRPGPGPVLGHSNPISSSSSSLHHFSPSMVREQSLVSNFRMDHDSESGPRRDTKTHTNHHGPAPGPGTIGASNKLNAIHSTSSESKLNTTLSGPGKPVPTSTTTVPQTQSRSCCKWIYDQRVGLSEISIMIICALLVAFVVQRNNRANEQFLSDKLESFGESITRAVNAQVYQAFLSGHHLHSVFSASPNTTRTQFQILAANMVDNRPGAMKAQWVQRVAHSERANFEAHVAAEYGRPMNITTRDLAYRGPGVSFKTVDPQQEYYPVKYVRPEETSRNIILANLLTSPPRAPYVRQARSSGETTLTQPAVVPFPVGQVGPIVIFVAYFPVYGAPYNQNVTGIPSDTLIEHSLGAAAIVFQVDDMLVSASSTLRISATIVTLCDVTNSGSPKVMATGYVDSSDHFFIDRTKLFTTLTPSEQVTMCTTMPEYTSPIAVENRQWSLGISRAPGFDEIHASEYKLEELIWVSVAAMVFVGTFVAINARRLRDRVSDNERLLRESRHANEAKAVFVAFLCHELRNPLHAIISASEELTCDDPSPEVTSEIMISSQTMLAIVNDMLDMSKIEAGAFEVSLKTLCLADVLTAVIAAHSTWASASNISLVLDIDPAVPSMIVSDQTRITQILNNLMSNALKFSSEGGRIRVCARVEMKAQSDMSVTTIDVPDIICDREADLQCNDSKQNYSIVKQPPSDTQPASASVSVCDNNLNVAAGSLILSVYDTGIGMTHDQLEKIFKPYTQLDQEPSANSATPGSSGSGNITGSTAHQTHVYGTGIGLNIVSTIVKALDGKIDVDSTPGQGTVFHIRMPLLLPSDNDYDSRYESNSHSEFGFSGNQIESTRQAHDMTSNAPHIGVKNSDEETKEAVTVGKPDILLIVDDASINRRIIMRHMKRMAPEVELVQCINGQEAVDFMLSESGKRVKCICMDLNMPVMCGTEATRVIRSHCPYHIDIVGVTANAFESDRECCFEAGMDDVLPKPFTQKQFQKVIASKFSP